MNLELWCECYGILLSDEVSIEAPKENSFHPLRRSARADSHQASVLPPPSPPSLPHHPPSLPLPSVSICEIGENGLLLDSHHTRRLQMRSAFRQKIKIAPLCDPRLPCKMF